MADLQARSIDVAPSCSRFSAMLRRHFLQLFSGTSVGACCAASRPAPERSGDPKSALQTRAMPGPIRAICFDLFTIFDPRSVLAVAERYAPGQAPALCEAWRTRQFEYSWLLAAGERYQDFRAVTEAALRFAASVRKVALSAAARDELVDAFTELTAWPDTRENLVRWRRAGLKLAPLSNYSPDMLERLISNAGFSELFDALISTHRARTFKPHPRAYALGTAELDLQRDEITFAAFGGWDAAGAKWFGYRTFWLNRLHVEPETLAPAADGVGSTLAELARFVEDR